MKLELNSPEICLPKSENQGTHFLNAVGMKNVKVVEERVVPTIKKKHAHVVD
jgi:hypothetical protein